MKWREKKLVILRDLVGAPAFVTDRKREVERLQGGLRFTTNLIEPDSDTKATTKRTRKRFHDWIASCQSSGSSHISWDD